MLLIIINRSRIWIIITMNDNDLLTILKPIFIIIIKRKNRESDAREEEDEKMEREDIGSR